MITGNGLIANALMETFEQDESVLIFARGVSNSGCSDDNAYSREMDMIQSYQSIAADKIFVYFSTTSMYDQEKQSTKYVQEKQKFEASIKSIFPKSIIIRLPIVVGKHNNENQLLGYLLKAIKHNNAINIYTNASRYLVDEADLPKIVSSIVLFYKQHQQQGNLTIDICGDQPTPIKDIVNMLSQAVGIEPLLVAKESGNTYFIDNSSIKTILNDNMLNKDFQQVFNAYFG